MLLLFYVEAKKQGGLNEWFNLDFENESLKLILEIGALKTVNISKVKAFKSGSFSKWIP